VFRFYVGGYSKLRRFCGDLRILTPTDGHLNRMTNEPGAQRGAQSSRGSSKFFAQREISSLQSDDYDDRWYSAVVKIGKQ
jgi:hypothetical protein